MTTKRIVYQRPDGVVVITPNAKNRRPDESEEAFLARVWAREKEVAKQIRKDGKPFNPSLTEDTPYTIMDASEVPTDYSKREKWALRHGKIVIPAE